MSKGFEGTKGPYYCAGRTVYALESCGFKRGEEQFRNRMSAHVDNGTGTPTHELEKVAELFAEAGTVLHETGLTPRQLDDECQIHRGAQHEIDQIAMGAGVFDILVEGELEAAWGNTKAAVRQLAEQRAELLEALREVAASLDWHAHGSCRGFNKGAILATEEACQFAKKAIANATQQRNATGGEG